MKVETIRITPRTARKMLEKNIGNRPLNKRHVDTLAREMELGRWKQNGDTFVLNCDRLIDGQHRLHAVMQSGVTITGLLVSDVASDVFDTKDVGRKRSASDVLAIRGEKSTAHLAAALCVVDRYMTGRMRAQVRYTHIDIEELLEKYPDIRESVAKTLSTKKLVPNSVLAAMHYLFAKKDREAADEFVDMLIKGVNMEEGCPVYALRERLVQNTLSKAKLRPELIAALIIKAWNHWRAGRRVSMIFYRDRGPKAEDFPMVA